MNFPLLPKRFFKFIVPTNLLGCYTMCLILGHEKNKLYGPVNE